MSCQAHTPPTKCRSGPLSQRLSSSALIVGVPQKIYLTFYQLTWDLGTCQDAERRHLSEGTAARGRAGRRRNYEIQTVCTLWAEQSPVGIVSFFIVVARPRIGTFLSLGSPGASAIISSRLDLILIDAEHGVGDERTLLAQIGAARCADRWIRVRRLGDAPKALDLGADGVVVPRIRTSTEVAELVKICSFPPHGIR